MTENQAPETPAPEIEERPFDARHFDQVAEGADTVVGMAIRVLMDNHPGYKFAIMSGATMALVRFHLGYFTEPPEVPTVRGTFNAMLPNINAAATALLAAKVDTADT